MRLSEIQIRDPFVLPDPASRRYYLFGTTDKNCWEGPGEGFNCYHSADLENWTGPIAAFRPPAGFWATTNFWAPEVHAFEGKYYMFASFKAPQRYRGTQILAAERPEGPYAPLTDGPITPPDWECLDGTLYVDEQGKPWIVFSHEWVQVHNGQMFAMRLSRDLRQPTGRPVYLFSATEADWVNKPDWPTIENSGGRPPRKFPIYVTDGPYLFRTRDGSLLMLWSSIGRQGYAMGIARSLSGRVEGPWQQTPQPIWGEDGGHGMIFRAFDGRLFLTLHSPNRTPDERPVFVEIEEADGTVRLKNPRRP